MELLLSPLPLPDVADRVLRGGEIVFTLNMAHLRNLNQSQDFRAAYATATIITLDSFFMEKWIFRQNLPVVTGSDLVEYLVRGNRLAGRRIGVVGNVSSQAIEKALPPADVLVLTPSFGFIHDEGEVLALLRDITVFDPNIVLLAVGSPQSEILAHRLFPHVPAASIICCGAAVEFITGSQNRAPAFFRRVGFEWLWRLAMNPRRLVPRYVRDLCFWYSNRQAFKTAPDGRVIFRSVSLRR